MSPTSMPPTGTANPSVSAAMVPVRASPECGRRPLTSITSGRPPHMVRTAAGRPPSPIAALRPSRANPAAHIDA